MVTSPRRWSYKRYRYNPLLSATACRRLEGSRRGTPTDWNSPSFRTALLQRTTGLVMEEVDLIWRKTDGMAAVPSRGTVSLSPGSPNDRIYRGGGVSFYVPIIIRFLYSLWIDVLAAGLRGVAIISFFISYCNWYDRIFYQSYSDTILSCQILIISRYK